MTLFVTSNYHKSLIVFIIVLLNILIVFFNIEKYIKIQEKTKRDVNLHS